MRSLLCKIYELNDLLVINLGLHVRRGLGVVTSVMPELVKGGLADVDAWPDRVFQFVSVCAIARPESYELT
jgi:hypothetical protein